MRDYCECSRLILDELRRGLEAVDPVQVDRFVDVLLGAQDVFFVGVGRVKLSLEAMAKRFYHLGISTHVVGDITEPCFTEACVLVVGSGSGESRVPLAIARVAKEKAPQCTLVHIGSNPASSLAPITDLMVRIPVQTKLHRPDEIVSRQIMSSLFEQTLLLLGDATALLIAERKRITDLKALWQYHANLE